jgi:vacuolar-type H+-ATPase subunit C/Vma6
MADIINLRTVRKAKARTEKEATAEANRIQFGRTKAEKLQTAAERALAEKKIDAHKRED